MAASSEERPTLDRLRRLADVPLRQALSDGLSDVLTGFAVALTAAACWLGRARALGFTFWAAAALLAAGAVLWMPGVYERLRERFVYPRGGYVAFEPTFGPMAQRRLRWGAAGAVLVLIAATFWFRTERLWLLAGGLGFLGLVPVARPGHRGTIAVAGVLSLAVGMVGLFNAATDAAVFPMTAVMFSMMAALGLVRFWRFCRRYPRPGSGHA
jgi:hypothetical protein